MQTKPVQNEVHALIAEQRRALDALEATIRSSSQANDNTAASAKGTRDIAPSRKLDDLVLDAFIARAQTAASVAAALSVPVARVLPVMAALRKAERLHNIGSEVEPRWQASLGDACSPSDLRALMLRLISDRPFSHAELVVVTGARANRVSGIIADLRESPAIRIVNLGERTRARYFAIPKDVKLARLPKR